MTTPERYEDTYDPKNPPNSILHRRPARSALLLWSIGALAAVCLIAAVVAIFWMSAHPYSLPASQLPSAEIAQPGEPVVFEFRTDGGHNPIPRPRNTSAELRFRGFRLDQAADSNR